MKGQGQANNLITHVGLSLRQRSVCACCHNAVCQSKASRQSWRGSTCCSVMAQPGSAVMALLAIHTCLKSGPGPYSHLGRIKLGQQADDSQLLLQDPPKLFVTHHQDCGNLPGPRPQQHQQQHQQQQLQECFCSVPCSCGIPTAAEAAAAAAHATCLGQQHDELTL